MKFNIMKTKLLRKVKKRFDIKYTDSKYSGVILHDKKRKEVVDSRNVREAFDWICYRLGMFYQHLAWRQRKDYKISLKRFLKK